MRQNDKEKKLFLRNKKGQFFLIAAVVIIVVIVSIVTISNYTQKKEVATLYDLGQELGIEGKNVLDYGTYNVKNPDEIIDLMEQFIQNYHDYQEQNKNVYFIFGTKETVNVLGYQDIAEEEICIKLNPKRNDDKTECKNYETIGTTQKFTIDEEINKVAIVIGETDQYEFRLKEGENFYFVIWQEIGGDRHVFANE